MLPKDNKTAAIVVKKAVDRIQNNIESLTAKDNKELLISIMVRIIKSYKCINNATNYVFG